MSVNPLSQSKHEAMSCPRFYVAIHVEKRPSADSEASDRGSDVHRVMSQYVDHCVAKRVGADWPAFDRMAAASGGEAGAILDRLRDSYEVDWQRVYGTEITMMLDEAFWPTYKIAEEHWPAYVAERRMMPTPSLDTINAGPAAHIGTADVIMLSADGQRAKVQDFKTHPSPFDADTYQGKLYSFMLLKHLPDLQQVTFELIFARYQNCTRSATYRRSDMSAIQAELSRARQRQLALEADPKSAVAIPCGQCVYCPLMRDLTCPLKDVNPYMTVAATERLMSMEFARRAAQYHRPMLKAWCEVNGNASYEDGNGKRYEYGKLDVPKTTYPLDATAIEALEMHRAASGENLLDGRLAISSTKFKPLLKAKKRGSLRQIFEDSIIVTETKPQWAVRLADGEMVSEYNLYEEEE